MPDSLHTRCPHCQATLPLKSGRAVGKKVPCPRCHQSFVVRPIKPAGTRASATDDAPADGPADDEFGAAAPPVVRNRNRVSRKQRRRREAAAERARERQKSMAIVGCFSMLVWINAHLAVAACIIDSGVYFVWMLLHFRELYEQTGVGRVVVRQVGQPLIVIITALIVWYQGVLWRDRSTRGAVIVFGAGYVFLFGLVALVVELLTQSVYQRSVYEIQWSAVYLGISLLAFAFWGYGPETTLQRAERLTSEGRYHDALAAVQKALQEDPDDRDAVDLERTLRDMIRFG